MRFKPITSCYLLCLSKYIHRNRALSLPGYLAIQLRFQSSHGKQPLEVTIHKRGHINSEWPWRGFLLEYWSRGLYQTLQWGSTILAKCMLLSRNLSPWSLSFVLQTHEICLSAWGSQHVIWLEKAQAVSRCSKIRAVWYCHIPQFKLHFGTCSSSL